MASSTTLDPCFMTLNGTCNLSYDVTLSQTALHDKNKLINCREKKVRDNGCVDLQQNKFRFDCPKSCLFQPHIVGREGLRSDELEEH